MPHSIPTRVIDRLADVAALGPDDAELLRRYRDAGDPEAFEGIVRRHARIVLGVCRRILADPHAAEDAFQATFLQLVRNARTVRSPAALAAWLYATARRTALRHRRPGPLPAVESPAGAGGPLDALTARELLTAIEDEIARLPERYRLPLILCYLDGLSKRQAADRLGVSVGVFCGRLDRGRGKLRAALVNRGFAPAVVLGMLAPTSGSASADLVRRTVGVCVRGEPTPAAVALLATVRPSVLTKAGLVVGVLLLGGLGVIAVAGRAEPPAPRAGLEPNQPIAAEPRRDLYGDPLPPDALARMGSVRWRHQDDSHGSVYAVPSPTGQLVATRNFVQRGTGWVRVWALPDGRPVCAIPWEHTFSGLAFTPDGSRLMILLPRGAVRFHDPLTGKLLAESEPVSGKGGSVEVTEDGRWIVTRRRGPGDDKMTLTEATADPAAKAHQVRLDPPPDEVSFDFFSCEGAALVGGAWGKASGWKPLIFHWDVKTGRLTRTSRLKTESSGLVAASSRDGRRVVTWRYDVPPDDVVRVWDTETGAEVVTLEGAARRGYGLFRFSPDGKRLVTTVNRTEMTRTAVVWELERGKVVARVDVPRWAERLFLLPDGKTILAVGAGMLFGTWDLATGRRLSPVTGHESGVRHLAFTPDGRTLLTASTDPDERVTAWDAATGRKGQELAAPQGLPRPLGGRSEPFALTPGGAVVTAGKGALVWTDLKTGRELRRVATGPVAAAMHPADNFHAVRLAPTHDPRSGEPAVLGLHTFGPDPVGSGEPVHRWKGVVTLWDARTGEPLAHRVFSRRYGEGGEVVSPDGRWLARRAYDPSAGTSRTVLESALGGRGSFALKHATDPGSPALFTPDGQTLVTLASGPAGSRTVRLWEVRTGKVRLEFPVSSEPSALSASRDGRFLAAERADARTIAVWDLATGAEVARRSGYASSVQTLVFRPDGQALASGHLDGTALVWDLSGLPGVKPAAADREAAWKDLASADAGTAYRAVLTLAADPSSVAFLRGRVKPAPEAPVGRVKELIKDLGADEYATREAATRALKELGEAAEAELRAALRGELSAEQQLRIADVLESRSPTEPDPNRLRALRCVEVLERVGSAETLAVLGELAKGAPAARLTAEAAGAVRRGTPPR